MDIFKEFAVDESKENEGVWHALGEGRMLGARAGNRRYARMLSREVEKHQRELDAKTDAADALSDKIMIDVMANTILLGFEGLTFKGAPLAYSVENAKMLLSVKDFRSLVNARANEFDAYRAVQEEDAVKN